MKTYFDTSALVAVYVTEAFSVAARREARAVGQVPYTPLHELELGNAFQLLVGRGLLSAGELKQLLGHVAEDRDALRLVDAPVDLLHVFDRARELSVAHSARLLCRSLDILHVAAALQLGCDRFVSGDDRQLALGRTLGFQMVDIKKRVSGRAGTRRR